jgi:hypothetical protein
MHGLLNLAVVPLLALGSEYYLFGAAGLVSIVAFASLILAPALGAYGRPWEKMAAAFLSLFVLAALVLAGLVLGLFVFFNWDRINEII